ncbi:STAS domain-containing protein [Polynucleobacter asymbioticus]|nr:STAS domain-containing protein [Polynucleobacter asymbioticus]
MSVEMTFETNEEGFTLVHLVGKIDALGAQKIDLQFNAIAKGHDKIIVNLENVDYLASMGIRTLIMGAKVLQLKNGKIALLNPSSEVEKVLSESGVDTLIPVCHDLEAAKKVILG